MRSSVDLPQPDGPTSTTNSPSCDREVDAVQDGDGAESLADVLDVDGGHGDLALDRAGRQALHEIALDQEEEEADRDQRQHAGRHHLPEVDGEFARRR